jgi:3-hydroxyacyl-[acyl-carrier-protein] dehydratase
VSTEIDESRVILEAEQKALEDLKELNYEQVMKCLPHRYPFLMIDKIIEINGDNSAIGIKNVTFNEPVFQGHFPGFPVFPGVLIIEGMAQTAGAIVNAARMGLDQQWHVLMLGVDKAKFRRPSHPGDTLEYHMTKIHRRTNVGRYEGRALVNGKLIAQAEISAMIVKAER